MLTKAQKSTIVEELTEKLKNNPTVIFTNYQGLKTDELLELRAKLRPLRSEYKVLKNTLSRRAFGQIQTGSVESYLSGPTAIILNKDDLIAVAKVVTTFAKDHEKLKIKACYSDGKIYSEQELKVLASLPPREVLLAKVVGMIASPLVRLLGALQSPVRALLAAVDAISKQKQETKT